MPGLFDFGGGGAGGLFGYAPKPPGWTPPTYSYDPNWANSPEALAVWNPNWRTASAVPQGASGAGGTPPPSIGTWPPTGGAIPRPTFEPPLPRGPNSDTLTTPYGGGPLSPAIAGLIQPGLVPDIARMSAETTAGRGIGGSPAAGSTAVKMSEQNYLQRLGLANQLLTGEAGRALPYQITPLQSAELANRLAVAGMRNFPGGGSFGYNPSRSGSGYGGGNFAGNYVSPYTPYRSMNYGGGLDTHGAIPGVDYGGGGGASPSLDDMLRELGIFGEDDTGAAQQPPDFDWEMWQ
jgi:hypothetical protein